MWFQRALRILALCPTLILTACGTIAELPSPNLQLSDACVRLPGKLPLPKKDRNGKIVLSNAMAGMETLNGRIGRKDECYRNQRQRLAGQQR